MPRVRDLLYRFRPAGAPGAAGRPGVPADRRGESAAELAPLFAELASTEQQCARILAQARQDAAEIREAGQRQAEAVAAAAGRRAAQERASTAAQIARHGESEAVAARQQAEAAVAALHDRATETMPVYVDAVADRVLDMVGGSRDGLLAPVTP